VDTIPGASFICVCKGEVFFDFWRLDKMKKYQIVVASALAFFTLGVANAAVVNVTLTNVITGSSNGESAATTLSGTLTGTYDDGTGIVTMDAGTTTMYFDLNPLPDNDLFTFNHTNWTTGAGAWSGSGFSCVEGQFGGIVGANLCGNYTFGTNALDDSSVDYGTVPGTRILNPDDVSIGVQQQGTDFASTTASFGGGSLIMETALWNGSPGTAASGGIQMTFTTSAVPVPAAVWLFGSALGLLSSVLPRTTT